MVSAGTMPGPMVVGVQISKKHLFSKVPIDSIQLIENYGVLGDSHAGSTDQHLYHIRRYGAQRNLRQVHLIHTELFDQLDDQRHAVRPGDLGENIATRGLDLLALPTGTRLRLGTDAIIELTGLRNPCHQIEDFQAGLLEHVVEHRPTGIFRKAGVMSIVTHGGIVRPGDPISVQLPAEPHRPLVYRTPVLDLRITAIRREAEGIHLLELRPPDDGALPAFTAGAHIDLMLTPELQRSYSLCSDPADTSRYVVCVRRDSNGRGGSRHVHDELHVGDQLSVRPPSNNFALFETAPHTILIGGGIGITPLKAMIHTLQRLGRSWELYYAARTRATAAFLPELQRLENEVPSRVYIHPSESAGTRLDLDAIITAAPETTHFYCCGPTGMIQSFQAATALLPKAQVHIEYFTAKGEPAQEGGYTVTLQRCKRSLPVPRGNTILDTLLSAGVEVPFSCKEGICGSCAVTVLAGEPDHRDAVLSREEQERNNQIMVCCSGSRTPTLVLDL